MKTLNIAKRIIRQIFNDKRSLGLFLIAPIVIFTLVFFLLGDSDYLPSVAVADVQPMIVQKIEEQGVTVETVSLDEGKQLVEDEKTDALIYSENGGLTLLFRSYDATKTGLVQKSVADALRSLSPGASMQTEYLYGETGSSTFDSTGYAMLGVIAFFVTFIIAGISFVRERTNQTMERLMVTPVRRRQIVLGYTVGFGLFAALQSVILLGFSVLVLRISIVGSFLMAGFIMLLLAMSAVCIGAFFSIFSNNEFQMMQFIPIVVIPQIFFSGMISLDTMPYHLGNLAKIMPVYYACDALKEVMVTGKGFAEIWPDLTALFLFILVFLFVNILALKKYRKI